MSRRIKRTNEFEIALVIKNENFIRAPRESQRNWLLNRAMKEFGDELIHLDQLVRRFVRGGEAIELQDRTQGALKDEEIMEDWQIPVMNEMAAIACERKGDVLEVGFGRGIASSFIQENGVRSHTIVECNDSIVGRYELWKQDYPEREIRLLHGKWQDMMDRLEQYDGILFHSYPLNGEEYIEHVVQSETFAEHFFAVAARHLNRGGTFTYLTTEIDSLSRGHQRRLLRQFTSFTVSMAKDLDLPDDTRDALWANSMVIVKAVK